MLNSSPRDSEQPDQLTNVTAPPCARALKLGCIIVALFIPLKLSLTYIILIPLIILWTLSSSWRYGVLFGSRLERSVTVPLAFLMLSTCLSALIGLDPLHSVAPLLSLLFFSLTVLVFRDYGNSYFVPLALVTGQAVAAAHTLLASTFSGALPEFFLGSVTESGQLALSLIACLGLAWQKLQSNQGSITPAVPRAAVVSGLLATVLLSSLGFHQDINLGIGAMATVWFGGALAFTVTLLLARPRSQEARGLLTLSALYLPLLLTALLLNLKRGPWLGVVVGVGVFCLFFARRFLMVVLAATIITAATVPPIRERLAVSYDHFTISGGRSTIWRIGGELISQYPLGIGYHNSAIMRKFSLEIPPELKHFHNNLINIAAESGILTAAIFCWFIIAVVRVCCRRPRIAFHVAIGCAFISWQTAGIVEYNFGDSEVMIIAWILLGLLLGDVRREASSAKA